MGLRTSIILVVLTMHIVSVSAQPLEDTKALHKDLSFLSSGSMEGRKAGTKYEEKAAKFIAKRFEEIGLQPMGDNQTFYQHFQLKAEGGNVNEASSKKKEVNKGINVVGFIDQWWEKYGSDLSAL